MEIEMTMICTRCESELITEDEIYLCLCERCTQREINRSNNRREWGAYHDEPCPEIELDKVR